MRNRPREKIRARERARKREREKERESMRKGERKTKGEKKGVARPTYTLIPYDPHPAANTRGHCVTESKLIPGSRHLALRNE